MKLRGARWLGMRPSALAPPRRLARPAVLVVALAALAPLAGCVVPDDVRAILLEESYAFDDRAPAEAASAMTFTGCTGDYDPETRLVTLASPSTFHPKFILVIHRAETSQGPGGMPDPMAGRYIPLFSGWSGEGPLAGVESFMDERMGSGSWGHSGPFGGAELEISYDGRGPKFDGERLARGERIERIETYQGTTGNATFEVTRTIVVEHLGRVPYRTQAAC